MGSRPRGCDAPVRARASTVEAAAPMVTVPRVRGVWPIARHAASSAWPPSVERTRTAFPAPCAAPSPPAPPASSCAAVSPRVCAARASRVTPCLFHPRAPVVKGCGVSSRCAPRRVHSMGALLVPRATCVPTASTDRGVSRTARSLGVPTGNTASASGTTSINVSWTPRVIVATPRAPRASAATCACPGAALFSGAPASATPCSPERVPPGMSAAWAAPP